MTIAGAMIVLAGALLTVFRSRKSLPEKKSPGSL
jgi:hypothetical protein